VEVAKSGGEESGMNAELRIAYRPDDEWCGQLDAIVKSGAFSGAGSAWFDRQSVKENFIAALHRFPISVSNPPMIESGFGSKERSGTLEQFHLRIAIRPYDVRGTLLVQVDLATESWTTPDSDQQQSVITRFLTEYAAVEVFASNLKQVLNGQRDFAVLPGIAK
jgi:hypothetical protein